MPSQGLRLKPSHHITCDVLHDELGAWMPLEGMFGCDHFMSRLPGPPFERHSKFYICNTLIQLYLVAGRLFLMHSSLSIYYTSH